MALILIGGANNGREDAAKDDASLVPNVPEGYDSVVGARSDIVGVPPLPDALFSFPFGGGLDAIRTPVPPRPEPVVALQSVQGLPGNAPAPRPYIPTADAARLREWACWLPWPCEEAISVAFCESRGVEVAFNPSGASGPWQLMMPLHEDLVDGDVFDPYVNAAAAYKLWAASGTWQHWSCKP